MSSTPCYIIYIYICYSCNRAHYWSHPTTTWHFQPQISEVLFFRQLSYSNWLQMTNEIHLWLILSDCILRKDTFRMVTFYLKTHVQFGGTETANHAIWASSDFSSTAIVWKHSVEKTEYAYITPLRRSLLSLFKEKGQLKTRWWPCSEQRADKGGSFCRFNFCVVRGCTLHTLAGYCILEQRKCFTNKDNF